MKTGITKDELELAIARYEKIPQSGCGGKEPATLGSLIENDDVVLITLEDCKEHEVSFPDDEYKVPFCGYFKDTQTPFWLYRQYPKDIHDDILISLG
jgi:hypothetical protein